MYMYVYHFIIVGYGNKLMNIQQTWSILDIVWPVWDSWVESQDTPPILCSQPRGPEVVLDVIRGAYLTVTIIAVGVSLVA